MPSLLASLPLASTVARLRCGELDLMQQINDVCDRIDALEPQIQALLPEADRRERLLSEAVALQQRFSDPAQRPPLYGALLGVKDVFVATGFPTKAGSQLPEALFAWPEASCVTKLREAGALVLGKTVTTEFAYFEPGPTRNPHRLAHTPGGSSSGSAAAVAAGFCELALGTQTIGSTIRPAAFCGIAGFKPTYGRIAADGLILCSPSLDTIGIFTQDLAGIALAAPLLCSGWQETSVTRMPTLGVPDGPYLAQASAEGLAAFEQQIASLAHIGYTVRRVSAMPDIDEVNQRHRRLVFAEMAQMHADWFTRYEPLYHLRTAAAIREGQTIGTDELAAAQAGRDRLRAELEALMEQQGIDLWICPATTGPAPEGIAATGDPIMNLPWTHAGMPALTLPAGKASNGLPLGLQVVGPTMADERLVTWAERIAEGLR